MKLGELKLSCLQAMRDLTKVTTVQELETLEKGDLADRSSKIIDSINRAIDYILASGVVNTTSTEIDAYDLKEKKDYFKCSIKEIASNIYRIDKINYEDENGNYVENVMFKYEGDNDIILPNKKYSKGVYIVVYTKELPSFTNSTSNNTEIPLKNEIAHLIPYFVKSELYEEDEPNLAVQAKNTFIEGIANILARKPISRPTFESVYSGEW